MSTRHYKAHNPFVLICFFSNWLNKRLIAKRSGNFYTTGILTENGGTKKPYE